MRRLLFVFLMMICSVSWAEWELLTKNDDGLLFVDKSTIRKSGDFVKMWSMINYGSSQTAGNRKYRSVISLNVYDCKEEATASASVAAYEGEMGSGRLVLSDNRQQSRWDWRPVIPGKIGKIEWEFACADK